MITLFDWGIWLVYLVIMIFVIWFYRHSKTESIYQFYLKGFLLKVVGSLGFALIYVYYYKFGDSFEYYKGGVRLVEAFFNAPVDYIDLIFSNSSKNHAVHLKHYTDSLSYSDSPEEWFMVKITSVFAFIGFKSYLVINLFLALISFWGSWKLFQVFTDILPNYNRLVFFTVFLIPSTLFWGSGLMKDTLTYTGVNYAIYVLYYGVIKGKYKPFMLLGSVLWIIIVFKLKSYIVIAIAPSIMLVFYLHFQSKIKTSILKFIIGPLMIASLAFFGFFGIRELSNISQKYSVQELEWKVKGFHSWHTSLGGSAYSLGDVEYTPLGVANKIPAALNVTFFRPYLWEASNPVVFLTAIESTLIFLLFIIVMFKTKLNLRKYLKSETLLKSLIVFVVIFGFAVGFTSYNFGALGRYKMPVMTIFVFTLLFVYQKQKEKKNIT